MNATFEQFTTTGKANFQALEGLTSQTFSSVEKPVVVNCSKVAFI